MQLNVGAFDVDAIGDVGFHRMIEASRSDSLNTVTVFCINRISPSESRNASVDSAPWFPLTRSTCKASRQPPVLEEHTSSPRSFQPRNQSKARCACSYHQESDVARYASRQADTVACTSMGCWSKVA